MYLAHSARGWPLCVVDSQQTSQREQSHPFEPELDCKTMMRKVGLVGILSRGAFSPCATSATPGVAASQHLVTRSRSSSMCMSRLTSVDEERDEDPSICWWDGWRKLACEAARLYGEKQRPATQSRPCSSSSMRCVGLPPPVFSRLACEHCSERTDQQP